MLQRLEKTVVVVNTDRDMRRIYDKQLPEGQQDIPAYDGTPATEVKLSAVIFARNWRRSWLWRANSEKAQAIRDELGRSEPEFATLTMRELGDVADRLGIDVPQRIKKNDLIALIEAATAVADETANNDSDPADGEDAGQEDSNEND